jgi:molecular chaperone GrpE
VSERAQRVGERRGDPAVEGGERADERPDAPEGPGTPGDERPPAAARDAPQETTEREPSPEVAQLRERLSRLEDRYRRALADLDNYRKRSVREVERRAAESREEVLRDWLEPVDSVERALRMGASEQEASPIGLRALLEQMEAMLARNGVRRVGAAGERFDPELHEAVDVRVTGEVPDRTILEVARSGFAIGDRVLRPAQVVVSRQPESEG